MAENPEKADGPSRSATRFGLPMVILIVILVIAAVGIGVGVTSASGSTHYSCFTITRPGNHVDLSTNGIVHISGTQYYVVCPEGTADPTTPTTVSCVTISPFVKTFTYPDAQSEVWYYIDAPGHTITVPGATGNSTEILQPANVSIQVSC